MDEKFKRTALLIGEENINKFADKKVAVFGIGGVGGYVVEALARTGIGSFLLVDNDVVSESNINRQIIATTATVGRYKTEVMQDRIKSINPSANVEIMNCFYLPETASKFDFSQYDYVVDAVDTVSAKLDIIVQANNANVSVISSMGAGNKLDPTAFMVADIYNTSVCPLAKVMRRELKKRNIKSLKCVYSKEEPVKNYVLDGDIELKGDAKNNRPAPGSIAFIPSVVGLIIASEVIKDLAKE